jgi:cell division protein FtsB
LKGSPELKGTSTARRCAEPVEVGAGQPPDQDEDQIQLRALTDALMTSIAQLSGQQYVDEYARRGGRSGQDQSNG